MGVGFLRPIEGHLLADQEELCSTQVEPSSSQDNQANGANDAPTQEQAQDPPIIDQVALQEPSSPSQDAKQLDQQWEGLEHVLELVHHLLHWLDYLVKRRAPLE